MPAENNRIALVTGANRGIGFEIARQLASKGMMVVMGARDLEKGEAARQVLRNAGFDLDLLRIDVTDHTTVHAALGRIQDRYGRLDVLVNNAGIMIDGHTGILELGISLFQKTLETNAFGPLLLSQACIPMMREQHYGRIVNLSSSLGSLSELSHPDSNYAETRSPAYRLSKTLLNGLTVLLAKELKDTNILVNAACPGWARTEIGGGQAPLSPVEAAATPVWLATLPDEGPSGGFFRERQPIPW